MIRRGENAHRAGLRRRAVTRARAAARAPRRRAARGERTRRNEPAASFDYLYIRAHEGNASGGHAALRFGDDAPSTSSTTAVGSTPRREDSRRFQHEYRSLQNRGIEVSRIAATPATVALLRDTFERRLLVQSRQLEIRDEMRARRRAARSARWRDDALRFDVRGAGFFAAPDARAAAAPPALLASCAIASPSATAPAGWRSDATRRSRRSARRRSRPSRWRRAGGRSARLPGGRSVADAPARATPSRRAAAIDVLEAPRPLAERRARWRSAGARRVARARRAAARTAAQRRARRSSTRPSRSPRVAARTGAKRCCSPRRASSRSTNRWRRIDS